MANIQIVTISLPKSLVRLVDREVKKNQYASRSELFRDLLRRVTLRETVVDDFARRWDLLTAPARRWAEKAGITEEDVLDVVMEDRYGKGAKGRS